MSGFGRSISLTNESGSLKPFTVMLKSRDQKPTARYPRYGAVVSYQLLAAVPRAELPSARTLECGSLLPLLPRELAPVGSATSVQKLEPSAKRRQQAALPKAEASLRT